MLGVVGVHLLIYNRAGINDEELEKNEISEPFQTRGHSKTDAHSMQCSGRRGVLAIVQIGNVVGLLSISREHS